MMQYISKQPQAIAIKEKWRTCCPSQGAAACPCLQVDQSRSKSKWIFPKTAVAPNHPYIDGIFLAINHPAIGDPPLMESPSHSNRSSFGDSHPSQAEVHLSQLFFEKDTEPYARQRDAQVLRMAQVPSSWFCRSGWWWLTMVDDGWWWLMFRYFNYFRSGIWRRMEPPSHPSTITSVSQHARLCCVMFFWFQHPAAWIAFMAFCPNLQENGVHVVALL